jgi:hypothetical protein
MTPSLGCMTDVRQNEARTRGEVATISPTIRDVKAEVYEEFGKRCAELGIHHRLGFERAVAAWKRCESVTTILDLPPFDKLGDTLKEEVRRRCKRNRLTPEAALVDAIIVWLRNFAFTDPLPPGTKAGKKKEKKKAPAEEHVGFPI